jgi:hypothetical protein
MMRASKNKKSRATLAMEKAVESSKTAIDAASIGHALSQEIRGWGEQTPLPAETKDAMETMESVFNLTEEWNIARLELAAACEGDVGELRNDEVRASRSKLEGVENAFKAINWPFAHLELQPQVKDRSR